MKEAIDSYIKFASQESRYFTILPAIAIILISIFVIILGDGHWTLGLFMGSSVSHLNIVQWLASQNLEGINK